MSTKISCSSCKADLPFRYCPYCGAQLEGASPRQVIPSHQAVSRDAQPAGGNRSMIVVSIVFGIIAMLLSAVYTPQSYTVLFTRAQQDAWLMTTAIVLTVLYFPLSYLQGALVGEGKPSWPKLTFKWVLCNLLAWVAWVIITGLGYLTSVMLILTHVLLGYTMSMIFIGYPIFLAMIAMLYIASVAIPVGLRQFAD